jgi:hypothetical protein
MSLDFAPYLDCRQNGRRRGVRMGCGCGISELLTQQTLCSVAAVQTSLQPPCNHDATSPHSLFRLLIFWDFAPSLDLRAGWTSMARRLGVGMCCD